MYPHNLVIAAAFQCHTNPLAQPAKFPQTVPQKHAKLGMRPKPRKDHRWIYLSTKTENFSTGSSSDDATLTNSAPRKPGTFVHEPSQWDDFFLHCELLQEESKEWMRQRAGKLKDEVHPLFEACNNIVQKMNLVDTIQHLGIDDMFEEETDSALHEIHENSFTGSSLHEVALRFRLLREHNLWVSPDVFNKFKGDDGMFRNDIANDIRGLLSLYNAAYVLIPGEPDLDKAISFARLHLEKVSQGTDDHHFPLSDQIKRNLLVPLPRAYKVLEARHYILEYEQDESHNPILLELAKLNFNLLQQVHLKEVKAFSEWFEDLYENVGLGFVRHRAVETYTNSCAHVHEERYALTRVIFAKMVLLCCFMDDIYDNYADIEECRMLNTAIQRWDEDAVYHLPEYMRNFYRRLLSNFKDMEAELPDAAKYRFARNKREFQECSSCQLRAAEYFHGNMKPASFEELVAVSYTSGGGRFLLVGQTIGRDDITDKAFELAFGTSTTMDVDVCVAGLKLGRFMNDMSAFRFGRNKTDVESALEWYVREHKVTRDTALAKIKSLVEEQWKIINKARFGDPVLLPVMKLALKIAVSTFVFNQDGCDYFMRQTTHLRETLLNLYVNPIPI